MKKIQPSLGISLIEVLAAITILSIALAAIYNVLDNSLHYYKLEEETVAIQQQANIIVNILQEHHQNSDSYTITVDNTQQTIAIDTTTITDDHYYYQLCYTSCANSDNIIHTTVVTPATDNFSFELIVRHKQFPTITYSIKTTLSRL